MRKKFMWVMVVLGLLAATGAEAATLMVTSREDSGDNTFRAAVGASNTTTGRDTIIFALSNSITVFTAVTVLDPVIIEGGGVTLGALGSGTNSVLVLGLSSNGSWVRNLAVVSGAIGIQIDSNGNTVSGCVIGIDWAESLRPHTYGIQVGGTLNLIGGTTAAARNILSGNDSYGVYLAGNMNAVIGNYVGINRAGTVALKNQVGIGLAGSRNVIGGSTAAERNVLSGNNIQAIDLTGAWNQIRGNYIGINAAGNGVINNGNNAAILCYTSDNRIQSNYLADRLFFTNNCQGNTIVGNYIGMLPTGNPTGNSYMGGIIFLNGAHDNYAGLRQTGQGNLIVGANTNGVEVNGASSINNGIFGNTLVACAAKPVALVSNANNDKLAPSISSAIAGVSISGSAAGNDYVEVFVAEGSAPSAGSLRFVGFANADGSGNWSLNPGSACQPGSFVCASTTDPLPGNNTSEYSVKAEVITATSTLTATQSPTPTATRTHSPTRTATLTSTPTPTYTITLTRTPTSTATPTATHSPTYTITPTATNTSTVTATPSITQSITTTSTSTMTPTVTKTPFAVNKDEVITYPSPARGETLWFYYYAEGGAEIKIKIYNILGELCSTLEDRQQDSGFKRTALALNRVAPGIYMYVLQITDAKGTHAFSPRKFVVVK